MFGSLLCVGEFLNGNLLQHSFYCSLPAVFFCQPLQHFIVVILALFTFVWLIYSDFSAASLSVSLSRRTIYNTFCLFQSTSEFLLLSNHQYLPLFFTDVSNLGMASSAIGCIPPHQWSADPPHRAAASSGSFPFFTTHLRFCLVSAPSYFFSSSLYSTVFPCHPDDEWEVVKIVIINITFAKKRSFASSSSHIKVSCFCL